MKSATFIGACIISLILLAVSPVFSDEAKQWDDGPAAPLLAQYLDDSGEQTGREKTRTLADLRNEERARPRCIIGIGGAVSARESFASLAAFVPVGMQYGKYGVTAEPAYLFMNTRSFRTDTGGFLNQITRTRTKGQVHSFSLPVKFSYSFLDLEGFPYTPYLAAGAGYAFRKFAMSGSNLLNRAGREIFIHSFTLDYGFGFLVKTTKDTRLNVGLQGTSFFNKKKGEFGYDTTGASITFSLMTLIR
ncbi:MAG: hypothetical protein JW838_14340 [Spirochaetes bacterium]|nr:hypothetical protein [Spirochaetota bacterium]